MLRDDQLNGKTMKQTALLSLTSLASSDDMPNMLAVICIDRNRQWQMFVRIMLGRITDASDNVTFM